MVVQTHFSQPTGPIGRSLPNCRWNRLLQGRGRFLANLDRRGMLFAAFVRSPEAHAVLEGIDCTKARAQDGVVAAFTAADMAKVCRPWRAEHALFDGARVPAEMPLAQDRVRYVGEPVAVVVATDHSIACEAAEHVALALTALPAVVDPVASLQDAAPAIHAEHAASRPVNLHHVLQRRASPANDGDTVEVTLRLHRIAPQPMETRGVLADWNAADGTLHVWQSHQHPHMMQDLYARLLGVPEHKVRVICEDVGGAFGLKQQLHPDEMATVCAAKLLGQPVRFLATRSESLIADAQARDHRLHASARLDPKSRQIAGVALVDHCGVGAFGLFPRTSFGEAAQTTRLFGAPYAISSIAAEAKLSFQNRPHLGHYRGVGHPVACLATEALMDKAAWRLGEHPIAFRRRHLHDTSKGAITTSAGIVIERYRMAECLDALADALAGEHRGRAGERLLGVGVCCLVEMVAPGSRYYGDGGVNISADETAVVRMEPSGVVRVATANTDQGQGADQTLLQIVADVLGLRVRDIEVTSGDSEMCPYGGGAFGSRQTILGGKAARDGALKLRQKLIEGAALLNQRSAEALHLADGAVRDLNGEIVMSLGDLARTCQFKPHLFPAGYDCGLTVVGRHTPRADAVVSSAAFGAAVEIDMATGVAAVRRFVVAHDGGTLINPAAVDAQLQGGAAQGLGQALLEAIRIDEAGQPLTGSFMDYAMPRADNVPQVEVIHLPPSSEDDFCPGGVGEAGTSGAPAAIFNAVNDALAAVGADIAELPATPEVVWRALQRAQPHESAA